MPALGQDHILRHCVLFAQLCSATPSSYLTTYLPKHCSVCTVWSPSVQFPAIGEGGLVPGEEGGSQNWQLGDDAIGTGYVEQHEFEMLPLFDGLWETFVEGPSAMDMIDPFYSSQCRSDDLF